MCPDPEDATPPEATTRDLAARAREGHAPSFAELYARLAPALWTWAQLRIRPSMRTRLDPDDLLQEVWTRAVRRFENFDPQTRSFRGWIFTIAKLVLLEGFRSLRDVPHGEGSGWSGRMGEIRDDVTGVSQRLARDEAMATFLERVESFSSEDRQVLVRVGLEGATLAEVAVQLGLSEEAVKKRWQRLRERLRDRRWAEDLLVDA